MGEGPSLSITMISKNIFIVILTNKIFPVMFFVDIFQVIFSNDIFLGIFLIAYLLEIDGDVMICSSIVNEDLKTYSF